MSKKLKAIGEMVVIRFEIIPQKQKKTAAGIVVIDTDKEPDKHEAIIDSIGGEVKDAEFKVGDSVVFNEHDMKMFEEENPKDLFRPIMKGIIRSSSIWGLYS